MSWRTTHRGKFQVRTAAGALVMVCYSIEDAEITATAGRSRDVWKWDGKQYRHYRSYANQ